MNPELAERVRRGTFASVTLEDDLVFEGYIAEDPSDITGFRMDGMILNEEGILQELSIGLSEEEILHIRFLPETPVFSDADGNELTMEEGFFSHLD